MKTNHAQEVRPIVVVSIISGIIMFVSGVYVAGSSMMFPPVMTVVFAISAIITICTVIRYNRTTDANLF